MSKLKIVTLQDGEYEALVRASVYCPKSGRFAVGKDYMVKSPSNPPIKARCTQNCPIALSIISEEVRKRKQKKA